MKKNLCNATIVISKKVYTCRMNAGHTGKHFHGSNKPKWGRYEAFSWDLEDQGWIILDIAPAVAAVIFGIETDADLSPVTSQTLQTAEVVIRKADKYVRDTLLELRLELQTVLSQVDNKIAILGPVKESFSDHMKRRYTETAGDETIEDDGIPF